MFLKIAINVKSLENQGDYYTVAFSGKIDITMGSKRCN